MYKDICIYYALAAASAALPHSKARTNVRAYVIASQNFLVTSPQQTTKISFHSIEP